MRTLLLTALLVLSTGCTDRKREPTNELSRRERDSIVGESRLPGAAGVRGALAAADSAEARRQRAADVH